MAEPKRLTYDDVMKIRTVLAETLLGHKDAFGRIEPINLTLLNSAIDRQNTAIGNVFKYTTISEIGATLFYGIAKNHAFENGNKRTALVSLLVFLDKNRIVLCNTSDDDIFNFTTQLVAGDLPLPAGSRRTSDSEVQATANWIGDHSRTLILGDRSLPFQELQGLLEDLGCKFYPPKKNFIKISRNQFLVKTGYPRKNFDVGVAEIKRIRSILKLDEIHGTDSTSFYDLDKGVSSFVNRYRLLLRRLADA